MFLVILTVVKYLTILTATLYTTLTVRTKGESSLTNVVNFLKLKKDCKRRWAYHPPRF
jgi:hypothetical protein